MQRIKHCLWFDDQAEEAVNFYTSIFKNSKIGQVTRYTKEGFEHHGRPEGSVMSIEFQLDGQEYLALNGGPIFKFTEALSLIVNCDTQEEVDYYWDKLSEGGDPASQVCGWLKDKYGLSWQIVPTLMAKLINSPDPVKAQNVLRVMFQMKKLDISALENA